MDTDDLEPAARKPKPKELDTLSVAELEAYIGTLEAEIARARAAIERKQSHRQGADSLFNFGKKKG
jgi:uncharacterized small protein (DUF1192 family)